MQLQRRPAPGPAQRRLGCAVWAVLACVTTGAGGGSRWGSVPVPATAPTPASTGATPATAPTGVGPTSSYPSRVVLAIAQTQLLDDVLNLPLGAGLTIGDWAARHADRERALRRWIRTRPATTPPIQVAVDVWQAYVRIEAFALMRELRRIADALPFPASGDDAIEASELEEVAGEWPPLESRAVFAADSSAGWESPPGWEDVSSEGVRLASEAARAMALHALLSEAARLKLTEVYQVRDFLRSSAAVEQALREELGEMAAVGVQYDPDQVATARAEIHVRDLISALARVHETHYTGNEVCASDFRTMRLLAGTGMIRAAANAIPPESCRLRSAPELLDGPTTAAVSPAVPAKREPAGSQPNTTRASR